MRFIAFSFLLISHIFCNVDVQQRFNAANSQYNETNYVKAIELYESIFVKPSKNFGTFLWKFIDIKFIDRFGPDGVSGFIKKCSLKASKFQSGFIYQYAFVMLLGFSALLTFLIVK